MKIIIKVIIKKIIMIWIGKRIKNHIAEITVDHIVLDPEITFIETISTLES